MNDIISIQLLSKYNNIVIDRFHICTWEIESYNPIIEIGMDINFECLADFRELNFTLFTPWEIRDAHDLFHQLKTDENAKFIFNESISKTENINNDSHFGVKHTFSVGPELTILPIEVHKDKKTINLSIDLSNYKLNPDTSNIYSRFYIIPEQKKIAIHKRGIAKSTIIYDTKVNERRNIPESLKNEISKLHYPKIKKCYNFNIIPSNNDIMFRDSSLVNVRNLEYQSFKRYLSSLIEDKKLRIKNQELLVVFNKKSELDSTYSFFSIYNKEYFGIKQVSIVLFLNLLCSILFFTPAFRNRSYHGNLSFFENLKILPFEIYIAFLLIITTLIYLFFPRLFSFLRVK